jgi:integrase/recombinase XerD
MGVKLPVIAERRSAVPGPRDRGLPLLIRKYGTAAETAWHDFFSGQIPNNNTRAAYTRALVRFLDWCDQHGRDLQRVMPGDVGDYFRQHPGSTSTKKVHLAALRKFFNLLVERHICLINPAAVAQLERLTVVEGKTPQITPAQIQRLVGALPNSTLAGKRDRAIIAILSFTGARAGAVAKLRRQDFYYVDMQWMLHFDEKGGKSREIPVRHDLEGIMFDYVRAAGLEENPGKSPLLRTAVRKENRLTDAGMTANDVCRMVKRRIRKAGLPANLSAHSFRVAVATDLFDQGVDTKDIQQLLGHSDPRTTRLYDRTDRKVTRNLVERIRIAI